MRNDDLLEVSLYTSAHLCTIAQLYCGKCAFTGKYDWSTRTCTCMHRPLSLTIYSCQYLPLIVKWIINILSNLNPGLSEILCNVNEIVASIVGNGRLLSSWVPYKGTRIDRSRRQVRWDPCCTFVLWDVDYGLSGVIKHHLWFIRKKSSWPVQVRISPARWE